MKYILTLLLLCSFPAIFGQDIKQIDKQLRAAMHKINYWAFYEGDNDKISPSDSLDKANDRFEQLFLRATTNPSTLNYDFKALQDSGLRIATSEDGLFRIYSWDTWTGGTMHFFRNVFQYKAGNKVISKSNRTSKKEESEAGSLYNEINDIASGNKQYYLAHKVSVYGSAYTYQAIQVFSIDNEKLNDTAKLIKTKTGIRNQLGYEVDRTSSANSDDNIPDYEIHYDKATKTISIPLIQASGKVTKQRILYRFTGKYFEKQ